jgi:hypothetical protein
MTKLGLSLLGVLMISSSAFAQPRPKPAPVFAKSTSFQSCTTSWAFACGKRTANGQTFGTAHEMKHCELYTFEPNGTYAVKGHGTSYGTYKMIGSTVRITPINDDGTTGTPFDLVLTSDGSKLGGMIRQ